MTRRTLVTGGTVVDGTNTPPYRADILIENGRIADIGLFGAVGEADVIDAAGQYVTPGFVDIHRHCDNAVFKENFGAVELAQGITAAVSGMCGLTPFPVNDGNIGELHGFLSPIMGNAAPGVPYDSYAAYNAARERTNPPIHIRSMIGSLSIRTAVKGFDDTPFTPEEMSMACRYVAEAMENGAPGLSMGLMYLPDYYSTRSELIELAKTAARYGGVLAVHIRNEGDSLPESVEEVSAIAETAALPLQISHFKSCGTQDRHGKLCEAIEIIEHRRRCGVDIQVDFYPYTGGATTILSLVPPAYIKESSGQAFSRMATRAGAEELKEMLCKPCDGWDNYLLSLGFERFIISSVINIRNEWMIGKTLQAVADEHPGVDPFHFLSGLIAEESGRTGIFVMSMDQRDMDMVAALPWSMVASDSLYPDSGLPHPRGFGTFPRVLRELVRERGILSPQTAIHKMTAIPAKRMSLTDSGVIRRGMRADLCVFDPARFTDHGDFTTPPSPASGMSYVLSGGKIAYTAVY